MPDWQPEIPEDASVIRVTGTLAIPRSELQFRTSRSSGPGGQHVNVTESRVELIFNVAESPALTDEQRARILEALGNRLDSDGNLHIVSSQERSQFRNRELAVARFVELLQRALRPQKKRRPTHVPRGAREARLQAKHHRSEAKQRRQRDGGWD